MNKEHKEILKDRKVHNRNDDSSDCESDDYNEDTE